MRWRPEFKNLGGCAPGGYACDHLVLEVDYGEKKGDHNTCKYFSGRHPIIRVKMIFSSSPLSVPAGR